jgi:hypothetical protein
LRLNSGEELAQQCQFSSLAFFDKRGAPRGVRRNATKRIPRIIAWNRKGTLLLCPASFVEKTEWACPVGQCGYGEFAASKWFAATEFFAKREEKGVTAKRVGADRWSRPTPW